ncbi:MAG TPA: hypothetical protein VFP65_22880 [Anaeromyxobacteraceae bacterium]|nr:hypothetical protein [Anaeromyxobacteraceae bacterium]
MTALGALAALSLVVRAAVECTPADPKAIAEAERRASDAEYKAEQAESIAVRSGNPGAQARATQAREQATAARDEAAKLQCKPTTRPAGQPLAPPAKSY